MRATASGCRLRGHGPAVARVAYELLDVLVPLARPPLGQQPSLRFAVVYEIVEAVEVDALVFAALVQLSLARKAARGDGDQLAAELVQGDAANLRRQAVTVRL